MTPPLKPDLSKLFDPKSVAVIGASNDIGKLSGQALATLLKHPFDGPVYPVNPKAPEVQGVKAYPSVADIPEPPDMAMIAIPAALVPDELERCVQAGVRAAVIITSGFAEESGEAGAALQARLQDTIRRHGLAVLGPNAQGFANFARSLCATFSVALRLAEAPLLPDWHAAEGGTGRLSVIAQSGALGFALYDTARRRELPVRSVITTGNEAGVTAMQAADYLLDEGGTEVLVMFLEAIRDPQEFARVAEKALRQSKPLVVAKVGLTEAAARSAASHTGAMAGAFRANKAMFDHYGVTLAESHEELIDMAAVMLANRRRLPAGRRIGICTSSGGAGGWTADACAMAGLQVPELEPEARARIDVHLPAYGSSINPVDGTAQAIHEIGSAELIRLVSTSERVDGLISISTGIHAEGFRREGPNFADVGLNLTKPVACWSYTRPSAETFALFAASGYPLSTNLRHTTRAMAALAAFAEAHEAFSPPLSAPPPASDAPAETLTERDAKSWLAEHGVCAPPGRLATSPEAAAEIAESLAAPAAFKIQSPDLPHKTDAGGVALNVTPERAAAEYDLMLARVAEAAPRARLDGVLIEPMAPPGGFEMILGVTRDALFGPMLLVGAGGVFAEILDDVAMAPLLGDRAAVLRLIAGLKCAPVLRGARGQPPKDIEALADTVLALCRFAAAHADTVEEIDLNPVLVHDAGAGVSVLDALIARRAPA
ncbi:MAG: acetate--CoA ligase family protein [Pseudomonadota bacterium]